jgi:transposase InsO family protein
LGNPRARYTREFMLEAVRMVRGGQSMAVVAKILGISQVVGWSMQPHMRTELVSDALRMAWFRRRPEAGLILHSDRGSTVMTSRTCSRATACAAR